MVSNKVLRGPSVVFEAVDVPCPGPFNFSHIAGYIYDLDRLSDPDVGPSVIVCDVEHHTIMPNLSVVVSVLGGFCPQNII